MTNVAKAFNSTLKTATTTDGPVVKVVNVEQFTTILQFFSVVSTLISLFGIVTNVFNLRTFFLIGLNDGVAVSFFALSISDMVYLCTFLCLRVFSSFPIVEEAGLFWFPIDPFVLILFSANTCIMTSFMSMFTVTFLAVARCLCVSMPLHFKNIFTTTKCMLFVISFAVFAISAYSPVFANMGVQRRFDQKQNASRLFIWFSKDRERIKDIVFLIFDTIMPLLVQVVLIACVIVMASKLKESAKFRQGQGQGQAKQEDDPAANNATGKLRARDLRVVNQVILISVIYIVANSPRVFNSLYTQFQPEFDLNKTYHYFYLILNDTRFLFECMNATANFFVYYNYNSSFRAVCFGSRRRRAGATAE